MIKYEDALLNKNNLYKTCNGKFFLDIKDICKPLESIEIHDFHCIEIRPENNYGVILSLSERYPKIYFETNGILLDPLMSLKNKVSQGIYTNIWDNYQTKKGKKFLSRINEYKPIKDGCAIVRNVKNGGRIIYYFNSFTEVIRSYEILETFVPYFADHISPIASKFEHILLPNEDAFWKTATIKQIYPEEKDKIYNFLKKINFNYYKCRAIANKYHLSLRELQCLYLIIQSKLNKQIAYELGLSQRTVEFYIENLKLKLNCNTKVDLVIKTLTTMT